MVLNNPVKLVQNQTHHHMAEVAHKLAHNWYKLVILTHQ